MWCNQAYAHFTVKPERRYLQTVRVVELIPCEVQTGSVRLSQFRNSEDEPEPQTSSQCDISHAPSYLQCPTTETVFNFKACGKMLRKDGCVKTHVLVHNKERPFGCDLCGKCYSAAHELKIHLRTQTGERPYPCKFCMKTFNQKAHVKEHERIHTDATNKQTDGSLLEHQDSNQGPLDSDSETSVIEVELSSVQEEPKTQQQLCTASSCESALATTDQRPPRIFTGKTDDFEGKGDIKMCMDSYAAVKLQRCDALICIDKSQLNEIQNGSGDDHLGVIQDEYSLQPPSHSNNSSDVSHPAFNLENLKTEVLFYCEICGKYFKNNKLLKKHILRNHKKKSHHCELCGKCFSFPYILRRHLRTHTGEEPHHCKFCGKMFANKGYVKDHERIHTRERPHSCSICGKRFVKMYLVRLHIQNCHKKTSDAKNHDKSNKTKQNAQGAYCCNLCGKSFDRKYTFNVHYRVHTGEKPYHCRFCDKAFRQKSHLMYHESTHAGQTI